MDNITKKYQEYLGEHIYNVQKSYKWIKENLPELLDDDTLAENDCNIFDLDDQIYSHDESKYSNSEWDAYAEYFYGKEKTDKVKNDFNYAWLHHIHKNPHHWQHWVLINDDDGTVALDMPYNYIIEMICDHWAFSWKSGDLYEIFNWYKDHKKGMVLSNNTKHTYEDILNKIEEKLNEE